MAQINLENESKSTIQIKYSTVEISLMVILAFALAKLFPYLGKLFLSQNLLLESIFAGFGFLLGFLVGKLLFSLLRKLFPRVIDKIDRSLEIKWKD